MAEAYLVGGVRTPVGRYGGVLASVRPDDLAALVVAEAVARAGIDPADLDEVVLGAANQAGEDNRNVARMAVLLAGFPDDIPAYTVNRLCASGMTAITQAALSVRAGDADLIVAGGVESMTRAPCLEALAKLKPVVAGGSVVTAGNASPLNDGASAIIVASAAAVEKYGLTPRARIVAGAAAGLAPEIMGLGPVPATQKALAKAGLSVDDLETVELNEAFASQSLSSMRRLGLDPSIVNSDGGAIALGHPLGSSGSRIVITLLGRLERAGTTRGLATMCIGEGQGQALIVERVS